MAPGNNERHPSNTGTIPKTKLRNNCNVPQEAVTPTRRDMASNLVTTSLDWVPVSEYNTRSNYNQSRKPTNNSSEHELTELDNSVSFESGFSRFVPVRPQPRILPLNAQNRDNITDQHDNPGTSTSGHNLHPYANQMQNGFIPHSNHAAAAVMIVNPTTPNTSTGNLSQPFNVQNQNRNNLTRNSNSTRNNFDGNNYSNNNTTPIPNSRTVTKTVNLINNMYDQGQGVFNNMNENNQIQRESARALGEAIVAACPDATAVERRLGQIREYIRVTSSLVDTMRNSEDEDVVVRPVSVQSNGSAYSENELWQNEIKNKMELSQSRLSTLKQQQKKLLKYQEEAKQQLDEMNMVRNAHEIHTSSAHDAFLAMQNRMYAANQIGIATTLTHSSEVDHTQNNLNQHAQPEYSSLNQDERLSTRGGNNSRNMESQSGERERESTIENDEGLLSERSRMLQLKLRELQLKKQHMENLVQEFQKLQMATRLGSSHNTYSSSGDDSGEEESARKCNKQTSNMKNEDPFKLMEINAIKAALQKTKDLMRTVENYEVDHLPGEPDESYQMPSQSNAHDNKSEGGGSMSGWSNDESVCRLRNTLPQRPKFTNEQHSIQQQSHEANIASLQELAKELRMETEKIIDERARIKDMVSNKDQSRKQKKVNEDIRASSSALGPAETRQMQLRALLADKQRELEALLNKEKVITSTTEGETFKSGSQTASVMNQSYNSEQEEPDSRSEQLVLNPQTVRDNESFMNAGDGSMGRISANAAYPQVSSTYASDSDGMLRSKSNQRNRLRRKLAQERHCDENIPLQVNNPNQSTRFEPRPETSNVNTVPPISQTGESFCNMPLPLPPQPWNTSKSNQDTRTNQFTQNSHSQTMELLMGTPQVSFPPSMPFNMMMPFGMVSSCACGCGYWGTWCWQQLVVQQREIHQLREQLNHLEERWRAESASHMLNNQVPPGNRANNYWDNFRSYSRQNLLSTNSKTNSDGHLGVGSSNNPHPLVERSHNTLHRVAVQSTNTPKRNMNTASSPHNVSYPTRSNEELHNRHITRNIYERSHSFSSAPDVLNINHNSDADSNVPISTSNVENLNQHSSSKNRPDSSSVRNVNITNPIPEIIQSHSNNLNISTNSKKKSCSKLPAKNSTKKKYQTENCQTNINNSAVPNLNLASTSQEVPDKADTKLFDLVKENIYSEVTTLIDVNESHPDFLIQLFRELQLISREPLRQKVLQSIRNILSQYYPIENQDNVVTSEDHKPEAQSSNTCQFEANVSCTSRDAYAMQVDNNLVRFLMLNNEEICTTDILETLASRILNMMDCEQTLQSKKKILDVLSKYEGIRLCDVSNDIIENLPSFLSGSNEGDESTQLTGELSESSILQDVAGSLNLFSSSDTQLHQLNSCSYDLWPRHVQVDGSDLNENDSPRSSHEDKVDLLNCSEMQNGDLAEADQTRPVQSDATVSSMHQDGSTALESLPDVVDMEEATPTEAEAEWLGLDRVPTRLHMESSESK